MNVSSLSFIATGRGSTNQPRDASTRVSRFVFFFLLNWKSSEKSLPRPPFNNNPCKTKIQPNQGILHWILIRPQCPEPNLKQGSRSLSSLRSRDRPRPRLRWCRRWGRSYPLVVSSSLVIRPKLPPTVPASTFEVLCACYREICESGCCC